MAKPTHSKTKKAESNAARSKRIMDGYFKKLGIFSEKDMKKIRRSRKAAEKANKK